MKCNEARPLFSLYLDSAVTGRQMQAVEAHLAGCEACRRDYAGLAQTQRLVCGLGRKPAPADLAVKVHVAISREAAAAHQSQFDGLRVRFANALNGFMVPATAGVVSAIIFFGLLISFLAIPAQLQATGNDVPTMLYSPPQLAASPFSEGFVNTNGDSVVVEAYVDANGRVQNYRILSAPENANALVPKLENMLIFTVFRPATAFGQPTSSRAVLSFSKINVKG